RSTTINLDRICLGIQGHTGSLQTNSKIWNSTRLKKIQNKRTRNFLWKAAHDIHKCGKFWKHLNGLEHRAHCPECNTEETLEHILTECKASGQEVVWKLTQQLLRMKNIQWEDISFGSIIGCGLANWKTEDGTRCPGADRLFTLVVSASAYYIWCLRCDWRIDDKCNKEKIVPPKAVHNRWLSMINGILKLDFQLSNTKYYKKRATKPSLVKKTWSGTLRDNNQLTKWKYLRWNPEVLVGIEPIKDHPRVRRRTNPPDRHIQ
ncbi:hypothetical protein BDQ17DRAFT_1244200, partial [Cyathus striatus]